MCSVLVNVIHGSRFLGSPRPGNEAMGWWSHEPGFAEGLTVVVIGFIGFFIGFIGFFIGFIVFL